MADTSTTIPDDSSPQETELSSGMSVVRIAQIMAVLLIGLIVLLFIFGLVMALTAAETWAPVIQIFRDILTIFLMVQGILIVGAIAILVIQIARFVIMLQTEIKPILDNARETTKATKATAQFVSKNASDPLIQIKSFFAGLATFIREILRLRRAVNPNKSSE